ncbi:UBX domain-containing protein 1-like isoform X2 [Dysidea avara]|uniref:UBX domain-containing protein 1-like isoform X2 n=1 Tax=Dysidea avara TaxID=196820 RepID=UPI003330492F
MLGTVPFYQEIHNPVVLLPSVFIIGHHGIPLDIIYGSKNVTTNELTMKITRSIELYRSGGTSPLARQRSQRMTPTKPDNTKRIRTSPSLNRNRPQRDQVTHARRPQQQVVSNPTPPAKTATATTGKVVRRTVEQRPSSTTTNVCRLQLRVFNSDRRLIKQFQPTDTLAVVKECAAEEFGMPLDTIILEKGYPAYTYKVEDEVKSLNKLQLTPSAILIVKHQTKGSSPFHLLSWILQLLMQLLMLVVVRPLQRLTGAVFGSSNNSTLSQPPPRSDNSWRKRGNVTSFRQEDDDDDDQNTYNGNSTQQQ